MTADPVLVALAEEIAGYPAPPDESGFSAEASGLAYGGVVVPLRLRTDRGVLSLFSTTTIFGTPVDVTLAELAIESFFPADPATGEALRALGHEAISRSG